VRLAKLAREGEAGLVLYRASPGAAKGAFAPHRHTGGEAYLVLKGLIADETGRYGRGSFVWLPRGSHHAPWTEGDTVVLVLWPEGVKKE
jgi:anti-sigma factor ChrR (cupin superfamily)